MTLSALADRVANAAFRRLPPYFSEMRADVWADVRREALDALEEATGTEAPDVEGHAHEAAYVPQVGAIACMRRLPGGGRCPVRFRAYLPGPGEAAALSTTGRHEWPPFDEADVTPPDGVGAGPTTASTPPEVPRAAASSAPDPAPAAEVAALAQEHQDVTANGVPIGGTVAVREAPPASELLTVPAAADVVTVTGPLTIVACEGGAYEPEQPAEHHP